ncbi:hypothetical protein T440DRAFT_472504 [Plenodomus tracheiphilus IPT5]|uniref:Basic proline-rich protein n=1 Tax=Plenodomus tracheiphilus IPT5 TaxID=1408161 RepID=A0A6A7ATX7_9PLEO|nr:hypothetical protein T440DRAFT_472504 [Plenodomus tracheiphilus IPT5]
MTAAHLSPPPAEAPEDLHHDQLIQRLKAMSTATDRERPTTTTSPRLGHASPLVSLQVVEEDSSAPAMFPTYTSKPPTRVSSLPETTVDMGEGNTLSRQPRNASDDSLTSRRPSTPRSQTAPSLDIMPVTHAQPPRNRSPYARTHLRTQSTSALPRAPPITRAHSLPTVMHPIGNLMLSPTPAPLARPASPLRSPKRTRSPRDLDSRAMASSPHERYGSGLRPTSIGSFEGAPSVCDISEDAELELTPRATSGASSLYSATGSLSRRRRPASPLYQVSVSFGGLSSNTSSVSTPTSTTSSPLLAPSKFNEQYPASLASSSVPSTPTSMRSRSPSISSLETIEDSPDAEEEAIEADRIARLKAAADREDGEEQRRSSMDQPEGRGRSLGFGKRDSRKRWSVCGAERRQDLDLETIWED